MLGIFRRLARVLMLRRNLLTPAQRKRVTQWATSEHALARHDTLSHEDYPVVQRRRPANRLGFVLQLCCLRYPGRACLPG